MKSIYEIWNQICISCLLNNSYSSSFHSWYVCIYVLRTQTRHQIYPWRQLWSFLSMQFRKLSKMSNNRLLRQVFSWKLSPLFMWITICNMFLVLMFVNSSYSYQPTFAYFVCSELSTYHFLVESTVIQTIHWWYIIQWRSNDLYTTHLSFVMYRAKPSVWTVLSQIVPLSKQD